MVLCSRASFIAGTQQKIRDRMNEEKNNNNEVSGMLMMMRKKVEEKKEFPITIAAVSSSLPWILRFFAILKGFTNLLCYSRVVRLDPCALPSCHHCSSPLRFWVLLRIVSHGMQTSKTPSISYQRVPFSFPRPWFFFEYKYVGIYVYILAVIHKASTFHSMLAEKFSAETGEMYHYRKTMTGSWGLEVILSLTPCTYTRARGTTTSFANPSSCVRS